MPRVRHTAEVHVSDVVEPVVTKERAKPTFQPRAAKRAINQRAVRTALRIAGGDASRLQFLDDGSVLVANKARTKLP